MNSKKPIWGFRAQSVRVTKSMSLTVEDSRKTIVINGKEKRVIKPAARKLIKRMLTRKRRRLPDALYMDSQAFKE